MYLIIIWITVIWSTISSKINCTSIIEHTILKVSLYIESEGHSSTAYLSHVICEVCHSFCNYSTIWIWRRFNQNDHLYIIVHWICHILHSYWEIWLQIRGILQGVIEPMLGHFYSLLLETMSYGIANILCYDVLYNDSFYNKIIQVNICFCLKVRTKIFRVFKFCT